MTPTARTLQECRRRGWIAEVVERFNHFSRTRKDLFGIIDIVAMDGKGGLIGIQATSAANHAARVDKSRGEHYLTHWKLAGGRFCVWSWGKKVHRNRDGSKSKVKRWEMREEYL